jgi:predicted FMN-binding regulatory protein PaiB
MYVHPKFAIGGRHAPAPLGPQDGAALVAAHLPFQGVARGGRRKFNQHKSDADHVAIVATLDEANDPKAHAIADMMRALRPRLDYGGETA